MNIDDYISIFDSEYFCDLDIEYKYPKDIYYRIDSECSPIRKHIDDFYNICTDNLYTYERGIAIQDIYAGHKRKRHFKYSIIL